MKKTVIALLAAVLVLSLGIGAFANGAYTMKYLPGTQDAVAGMPDDAACVRGEAFAVSDGIPTRDGYEFVSWVLDYDTVDKYSLTYSVAGDLVYGTPADAAVPASVNDIWVGTDVALAAPLTTSWETADGSPAPTTANYIVKYITGSDENAKEILPTRYVMEAPIGEEASQSAETVEGFAVRGESTKAITVKPDTVGTWTFSGWCSDEACTTPVTEIKGIFADTTVYGCWKYSEVENVNEIVFEYDPLYTLTYVLVDGFDPCSLGVPETVTGIIGGSNVTLADPLEAPVVTPPEAPEDSYTVKYLDINTCEPVAKEKVVTGVHVGDVVTERALASEEVDVEGYILVGDEEQTLEIKQSWIIKTLFGGWCSDETCRDTITSVDNISADTTVYGKWDREEIEVAKNEIIFYYDEYVGPQTVAYTVQYIDRATGKAIWPDKYVTDVEPGTHVIEYPEAVSGFKAMQPKYEWDVVGNEVKIFIYYEYSEPLCN